jgi:hypothetical protein
MTVRERSPRAPTRLEEVFGVRDLGDQLQIADTVANRDVHRMAIDETRKGNAGSLAVMRFDQEVVIGRPPER